MINQTQKGDRARGSRRNSTVLALIAVIALTTVSCSSRPAELAARAGVIDLTVLISGLDNPRGVAVRSPTEIFVVEAGTGRDAVDQTQNTGKLSQLTDRNGDGDFADDGEIDRWFKNLPTYNALSFFGTGRDEVSGPGDVLIHDDGRIFLGIDGGFDEQNLYEISPERRIVKSLASRSNMTGIAFDLNQAHIYATESTANDLIETSLSGEVRAIAKFWPLRHGQQAVPAGLAVNPVSGVILVALFSGNAVDAETGVVTPFVRGDSKVVRVDPASGRVYDSITGLTLAVDVAVDEAGNVFVVEMASEPADPLPRLYDLFDPDGRALAGGYLRFSGRVTMYPVNSGAPVVIGDGLDLPTNITVAADGSLYVSTGQGTPGRPIPGPDGPTRINGQVIRISNYPGQVTAGS